MWQLVQPCNEHLIGEYKTRQEAIDAMVDEYEKIYPPNNEAIDYECCNEAEGYANDSNGEILFRVFKEPKCPIIKPKNYILI